jgi:hypothetical protein
VDAVGIRPIGLGGNRHESLFGNELLRDLGTFPIKFTGTVRGFAEQHQLCVADEVEEIIVVMLRAF